MRGLEITNDNVLYHGLFGRPPLPEATWRKIEELRNAGKSVNAIRKELKIGYGTAWNYVRAMGRAS